jgi:hypothetical protein
MVKTFFLRETSRENRWIGRDRPLGHLPTFSSEKLEVGLYRISLGKPFHSIFDEANEQKKKKKRSRRRRKIRSKYFPNQLYFILSSGVKQIRFFFVCCWTLVSVG